MEHYFIGKLQQLKTHEGLLDPWCIEIHGVLVYNDKDRHKNSSVHTPPNELRKCCASHARAIQLPVLLEHSIKSQKVRLAVSGILGWIVS